MLKQPKNIIYNFFFKKKLKRNCFNYGLIFLKFGSFGFKSKTKFNLTFKEVDTLRKLIKFRFKKRSRIWFRCSFNIPLLAKPKESRMGKGKGKIVSWVSNVPKGKIILELDNLNYLKMYFLITSLRNKLSTKICIVKKPYIVW